MSGTFLLDNQNIKEPDDILVALDGHSVYTKTWIIRNNGYEPSIWFWINIHIILVMFLTVFFVSPKLEPNEDIQLLREMVYIEIGDETR